MKFNLKTSIVLEKEFSVEASTLKEAMDLVEKQICENVDLNSLEISEIDYDMTDPTIAKYNNKMCKEAIKGNLKKLTLLTN